MPFNCALLQNVQNYYKYSLFYSLALTSSEEETPLCCFVSSELLTHKQRRSCHFFHSSERCATVGTNTNDPFAVVNIRRVANSNRSSVGIGSGSPRITKTNRHRRPSHKNRESAITVLLTADSSALGLAGVKVKTRHCWSDRLLVRRSCVPSPYQKRKARCGIFLFPRRIVQPAAHSESVVGSSFLASSGRAAGVTYWIVSATTVRNL